MKLIKCPYCSKPISYFTAFNMRSRGEYFCNNCKKESNILIKKILIIPFIIATAVSLLILGAFFTFTSRESLWFMLFVAIPFFVFYLITPFFVVLKAKKNYTDVLYDTEIVESPVTDPDPTVVKKSRVVPAFVDDVVFDSSTPVINTDVFEAVKNGKRVVEENSQGDTKSFSKFENISSQKSMDATMPVTNIKNVQVKPQHSDDNNTSDDGSYDLSLFE